MKASAVICEYNPFHNGHKYQLERIKEKSDNAVVAVMSGNFTQRGDIAIADKFTRAKIAVQNGVDLVTELPAVYACSSAQSFARGGVRLAQALGCTERLCFSAEEKNQALLLKVAEAFENPDFNAQIRDSMKQGEYYPRAVSAAAEKLYSKQLSLTLSKPNNILAAEYIKMLRQTDIEPYIIQRTGAEHDRDECCGNITSASNLRKMMLNNDAEAYKYMPPCNRAELKSPVGIEALERVILYKLRTMKKEELSALPDVTEGLENRIYEAVRSSTSLKETLDLIKTKRYTLSRLRRIIICALLNITSEMTKQDVPYIRVLAFNSKGEKLLKEIKKADRLPMITNVADGYRRLDGIAGKIFETDLLASDIFALACDDIKPCSSDFTTGVINLNTNKKQTSQKR